MCQALYVLNSLYILTHWIFSITLGDKHYFYPHFIDIETEAQGE